MEDNPDNNVAQLQPQPQADGPNLQPGITYLLVPMDVIGDIIKNFDTQPHGDVKKLEQQLMGCQPIANNEKPDG